MDDWTYPEQPNPGAEADEWLAWYEDHCDHLDNVIAQLRHDRNVLVENLIDVRNAVWRMGMNATIQRYNDDRLEEE